jgi:hypothetical protein
LAQDRATATPRPRARRPLSLVASGRRIDVSDRALLDQYRKRQTRNFWQSDAWALTNAVPELSYAMAYTRDAMSRVGIVPALIPDDPSLLPIPLDDDNAPDGVDAAECWSILQRLAPFPEYMGAVAQNLDIAGECHVAIVKDDDALTGERCRVFSTDELTAKGEEWYYRSDPGDSSGTKLDVIAGNYWRIWQPNAQYSNEPWSHMIAMLGIGNELLLLTQAIKALSRSRIAMAGGYLFIPDELSLMPATDDSGAPTDDAGDGEAREDTFIEDLMAASEAALLDPESAAAVMRIIIRGPADIGEKIKPIDLDRQIDATTLQLRGELIERIANGVNLPREVVLGLGATNHWNAEEIRNQSWRNHLEPRAMSIVSATTQAYYRPNLIAAGMDPDIVRRMVAWYDPAWYVGTPDLAESADEAFNLYAISWDAYRREKGWDADDAPDLDEVNLRIWIKQQERVTTRVAGEVAPGEETLPEPSPGDSGDTPIDDADVTSVPIDSAAPKSSSPTSGKKPVATPSEAAPDTPNKKMVASVSSIVDRRLAKLGPKLTGIERDLRVRLQQTASQVVTHALERAGLRARNAVQRQSTRSGRPPGTLRKDAPPEVLAAYEATMNLPAVEICAAVGPFAMATLGLSEHDLLAGATATLEGQYHRLVRRAQHAAGQAAATATGNEFDERDLDQQLADDRDRGWAVFSAGIMGLAGSLLYNPHPSAPTVGEFDATSVVPMGLVRDALDVAGGSTPPEVDPNVGDGPTGLGATAGPSMADAFAETFDIAPDTYEWVYGDAPRRTFIPHEDLDGATFLAWDDDVLSNGDDWPPVPFFSPGDHDGCECDVVITWTSSVGSAESLGGQTPEGE